MHDTHGHLDILLERLMVLPVDQRELNFQSLSQEQITKSRQISSSLLQNHDWFVQVAISINNFDLVYKLFEPIAKIKYIFGSHPELVDQDFDPVRYLQLYQDYIQSKNVFSDPQIIGMGEIGLDYYYTQDVEIIAKQHLLLQGLLQIATENKITPVFHIRDAFDDFFAILDDFPSLHGRFLVHCFTGDRAHLKSILDRGGKVGYGGIITFGQNADNLRETVLTCPLDGFVLETDLPFLAPAPNRGNDCLPTHIDLVADKISDLKAISKTQVWQFSNSNSGQLFPNLSVST
jgi:TatD DNase family protein